MYEELKEEMEKQGLTTHGLAKRAKMAPPDLYTALKGERTLFPGWRKRIAAALDVKECDLFPELESAREEEGKKMLRKFIDKYGYIKAFSAIVTEIDKL